MYFNYTKYIPIVFNYKIQITFIKATKYKVLYMYFKYSISITCISLLQYWSTLIKIFQPNP